MGLNPHLIRNWKINKAFNKLVEALLPLTEENADVKSIFASKTFWANLLMAGAGLAGQLPANKYTAVAVGVINIGLRFLATGPVSITGN